MMYKLQINPKTGKLLVWWDGKLIKYITPAIIEELNMCLEDTPLSLSGNEIRSLNK